MTPLEMKRQFVLLILQFLNDENYKETLHQLEKESGFFFDMEYFEELVTQRDQLDEAEKYLSGFTTIENLHSKKIFFEIRKQKFLEALDRNDKVKAIYILENELKLLIGDDEKLYIEMMTLLTLKDFREMEKLSGYVDANSARASLAESLKAFIHENTVFQDKLLFPGTSGKRLWELLNQSMYWQHQKCMNDWPLSSIELETLFEDHTCKQPPGWLAPFPANNPGGFMSARTVGQATFSPEPARALRSPIISLTPNEIIERPLLPLPASVAWPPPPASVLQLLRPASVARLPPPARVTRPPPLASVARRPSPARNVRLPLPESVATVLARLQPPPVTVAIVSPASVARLMPRVPPPVIIAGPPPPVSGATLPPPVIDARPPPPARFAGVPPPVSFATLPQPVIIARVPPPASVGRVPPLVSVARVPPLVSVARVSPPARVPRLPPPVSVARVPLPARIARVPPLARVARVPPIVRISRVPPPATVIRLPPLENITTLLPPADVIRLPPPVSVIRLPPSANVTAAPIQSPSFRNAVAASSGIQQSSSVTSSSAVGGEQDVFGDFPRTVVAYLSEGSFVSSMAFHPLRHALLLVGTKSGVVSIWDVGSKKRLVQRYFKIWEVSSSSDTSQLASLANECASVNCVSWSHEGVLFGVGYSKRILHIYSYFGEAVLHNQLQIDAHAGNVSDLTFARIKAILCVVTCGDDTNVKIWDAATGSQLFTFVGHEAPVYSLCVSYEGKVFQLLSASSDGAIKQWGYSESNYGDAFAPDLSNIRLRYSANGKRLFSSCTLKKRIPVLIEWRYLGCNNMELRAYQGLGTSVEVVQFDTIREYLAVADESVIKFWHMDHPELLVTINYVGGLPASPCIRFNKAGTLLAVSTIDNAVKVLANADGMQLVRFYETLSLRL